MTRAKIFYLLIALSLVSGLSGVQAMELVEGPFRSIKEAKHYEQFLREVYVAPDHFDWEGHDVVVSQAWLDKQNYLTFRLKVDGRELKEHLIRHDQEKAIIFKEEPNWHLLSEKRSGEVFQQHIYSGVFAHYVSVAADPMPKTVKLRIGTYVGAYHQYWGGTVLTFFLDEKPTPETLNAVNSDPSPPLVREGPFTSIEEAKSFSQLLEEVHVVPDHFDWEGHEVSVWEAWLDKQAHLTFKFKMDGHDLRECRIMDKEDKRLIFKEDPQCLVLNKEPGWFRYPHPCIRKSLFEVYDGTMVYFFTVNAEPIPKNVRLKIGTWSSKEDSKWSDTVLTFQLDNK